jgi:hypothetical protein
MTHNPKRVIFVCVENSNRSQMAEAFAHIHGSDHVEAFSAGSWPSGQINPKAGEAMKDASLLDPAAAAAARPVFLPVPDVSTGQEVPALRAMPSRCQKAPGADEDD